jgi:uncharacterized membrane protein YgcG
VSRLSSAWALLLAALLAFAAPSHADERILRFDSEVAIQPDGSLEVTEAIRVRVEGNQIRRGIYRDFPTRYEDRLGNRVRVEFTLVDVLRDGRPTPHFTEKRNNGVRINTGNDDLLPTGIETTFTLRYRTTRQLGYFDGHDELYWNATGNGWAFPIDAATARVTLPSPVPAAQLRLDAYTGRQGESGRDATATAPQPGVAEFRTTRTLLPGEGLTLSVGFPKGVVPEPTEAMRTRWFFRDNAGLLVGVLGFLLLAGFYAIRWLGIGRDPPPGSIFPRYDPPEDFGPAELRSLRRMDTDRLGFTADVVDMAVRGFLQIHGGGKDDWRLVREADARLDTLTPSQRALAARLFRDGNEVELKTAQASLLSSAIAAHAKALDARLKPRYYRSNLRDVLIGMAFSVLVGIAALALAVGPGQKHGVIVLLGLGFLTLVMHVSFAVLIRAPTPEGRKLLDAVDGLKLYLGVAERDELKTLRGPRRATGTDGKAEPPPLDAARYEALLPYAIALEVEDAWTAQFTRAVGAAMAQQAQPAWYHGTTGRQGFAALGSSIGSALNTQISSSATPPGSSSGGGGGGFSGGGGGGGGGGGR